MGATLRGWRADVRTDGRCEARPRLPVETGESGSEHAPNSDLGDGGRRSPYAGRYSS
jgi:hypothetical protein